MSIDDRTITRIRLILAAVSLTALAIAYGFSDSFRTEVNRAMTILSRGDVTAVKDYILSFGVWAPVVSASLMVLQALAAPLPSFLLAFANGLAFGAFWGGMLSLVSATLAAGLCFWIARALGRAPVEAIVGRAGLDAADRWFERWGVHAILIARLIPIVSFDVISYAAGLTRVRFCGFILATVIGMAPATFVYSYLGQEAPQYIQVLLVVFGVVVAGGLIAAFLRRRERSGPTG